MIHSHLGTFQFDYSDESGKALVIILNFYNNQIKDNFRV